MMGILLLGDDEHAAINAAIARARANPMPFNAEVATNDDTDRLLLDERKPGATEWRDQYPAQLVRLGSYTAAISFEQQPAGLFRHMSVAVDKRGSLPGLEAIEALVTAFGFSGVPLQRPGKTWSEEYRPGHFAFNIVELEPLNG
jgi:hypothetical protein